MHRAEPTTEDEPSDEGRWRRLLRWGLERVGLLRRKDTEVSSDLVRFGRQLRESGHKVVAFVPATDDAPTTLVCHQLALALARMSDQAVGWVDVGANHIDAVRAQVGDAAIEDDGVFRTALVGGVRWIAPLRAAPEGTRFQLVAVLVSHAQVAVHPPLEYVLLDLGGFTRTGELLGTFELLDGVVIVGRTGVTDQKDLLRLYRIIPEQLNLGVLLTQ